MIDELAELKLQVVSKAKELGLAVFPAGIDDHAAVRAIWSGECQEFLVWAARLGATVIYVATRSYEEDELPCHPDSEPSPGYYSADDLAYREALRPRLGQLVQLDAVFLAGGVVHRFQRLPEWYVDVTTSPTGDLARWLNGNEPTGPGYDDLVDRAEEEGWVEKIISDPLFYGGKNVAVRRQVVAAFVEEQDLDNPGWGLEMRLTNHLVFEAELRLTDVRREIEDQATAAIPELAAQLAFENAEWGSWRMPMRERQAKRLVTERYGWSIAAVVSEVARYQPG